MTDAQRLIAFVETYLFDFVITRHKWDKGFAPVRYTYYCTACDSEADTEDEIEHDADCVVVQWRKLKEEITGDE